jgi:hypothetical protein
MKRGKKTIIWKNTYTETEIEYSFPSCPYSFPILSSGEEIIREK